MKCPWCVLGVRPGTRIPCPICKGKTRIRKWKYERPLEVESKKDVVGK